MLKQTQKNGRIRPRILQQTKNSSWKYKNTGSRTGLRRLLTIHLCEEVRFGTISCILLGSVNTTKGREAVKAGKQLFIYQGEDGGYLRTLDTNEIYPIVNNELEEISDPEYILFLAQTVENCKPLRPADKKLDETQAERSQNSTGTPPKALNNHFTKGSKRANYLYHELKKLPEYWAQNAVSIEVVSPRATPSTTVPRAEGTMIYPEQHGNRENLAKTKFDNSPSFSLMETLATAPVARRAVEQGMRPETDPTQLLQWQQSATAGVPAFPQMPPELIDLTRTSIPRLQEEHPSTGQHIENASQYHGQNSAFRR